MTQDRIRQAKEKAKAEGYRWVVLDLDLDEIEFVRTKREADKAARHRRVTADMFLETCTNVVVDRV